MLSKAINNQTLSFLYQNSLNVQGYQERESLRSYRMNDLVVISHIPCCSCSQETFEQVPLLKPVDCYCRPL